MNAPPATSKGLAGKSELLLLIGCAAAYSTGTVNSSLVPQIVSGAMQHYHASASVAGLVAMAEGLTVGLLSMLLGKRPPAMGYRKMALFALLGYMAANAASILAPTLWVFVVLRMLAGAATATMIYTALALVAATRQPDRSYSVLYIAGNLYAAAALAVWPVIAPNASVLTYLPFIAGLAVLLAPLIATLPSPTPMEWAGDHGAHIDGAVMPRHSRSLFLALVLAVIVLCPATYMVYVFSIPLGERIGLSSGAMGTILGAAFMGAAVTPVFSAFVASRLGRYWPIVVANAIMVVGAFVSCVTRDPIIFAASLIISNMAVHFVLPLYLGWTAALDPSGRGSGVMMGSFLVTLAILPALIGKLVDYGTLSIMAPTVVAIAVVVTLVLIFLKMAEASSARHKAELPAAATPS